MNTNPTQKEARRMGIEEEIRVLQERNARLAMGGCITDAERRDAHSVEFVVCERCAAVVVWPVGSPDWRCGACGSTDSTSTDSQLVAEWRSGKVREEAERQWDEVVAAEEAVGDHPGDGPAGPSGEKLAEQGLAPGEVEEIKREYGIGAYHPDIQGGV